MKGIGRLHKAFLDVDLDVEMGYQLVVEVLWTLIMEVTFCQVIILYNKEESISRRTFSYWRK